MSNILFLYNNLIDLATLTASSEASGFPASNLKNPFRSKPWRTAVSALYTSSFSVGADGFVALWGAVAGNIDGIAGYDDTLRFTCDTNNNQHYVNKTTFLTAGKKYSGTLKYYIPSGQSNIDGIRLICGATWASDLANTAGAWTTLTFEFTANSTNLAVIAHDGAANVFQDAGDDVFYLKDIVITESSSLLIDHGTAKAVTCVALIGYNWTSAPGTLNFEANATDSWGSPSFSQALTWAANPTANGNNGIIIKTVPSQSYRYNRLNVIYPSTGTPTDFDLGRIFVGEYFQPTAPYKYGITNQIVDPSLISKTIGGQKHADVLEKYREVNFTIEPRSQAQWELFQAMLNSRGITKDLVIAFDYTNEPDEMTIYGHFADPLPVMTQSYRTAFSLPFVFQEAR